jgi:hypothetical protein
LPRNVRAARLRLRPVRQTSPRPDTYGRVAVETTEPLTVEEASCARAEAFGRVRVHQRAYTKIRRKEDDWPLQPRAQRRLPQRACRQGDNAHRLPHLIWEQCDCSCHRGREYVDGGWVGAMRQTSGVA